MGGFSEVANFYSTPAVEKINYRSIGRGSGGVATSSKHHSYWRDFDCSTIPSIPSKFETVLYRGNQERKGFTSQTPRFGQESRHGEQPGPGAHRSPAGLAVQLAKSNVIGKKGHNCFVSKTPREQKQVPPRQPGPGSYEPPSEGLAAATGGSQPSAAFVPASSMNPAKFNARPSPGPGDYTSKATSSGPPSSRNVVISRTGEHLERSVQPSSTNVPGPGSYDPGRSHSEPPKSNDNLKKRVLVEQPLAGLTDTAQIRLGREYLEKHANTDPDEKRDTSKLDSESVAKPQECGPSESRVFKSGNSHMPRKWRDPSPGPGQYDTAVGTDSTRGAAVSSFTSKAFRFREKPPPAPGPAYYNPKTLGGGSSDFHLNPQSLWV